MSVRIATHGSESKSCIFTTYINVLATSKYYQNILTKNNEENIVPSRVVSRHFNVISRRGFEPSNGVLRVPGRDVVGNHDVFGHDVPSVFDDVIEDRTSTRSERVQLDSHGRLVQLQHLGGVRNVRFW